MEEHIKSIIAEDLKAQEAYQQAEIKINESLAGIHKEKPRIEDEVWAAAKAKVESEKQRLSKQLETAQKEREQTYNQALKKLEARFEANHTTWRKTLLNRCIHRENE